MNHSRTLLVFALGASVALAGCDRRDQAGDAGNARDIAASGDRQVADPAPVADPADATLAMSAGPTQHLVDGAGSAVYVLAGNADGSRCDAACEEVWPPVMATDATPTAGMGVESTRIGTLERDGRTHVTFGGAPLYRYSGDAGANRTAGAGVEDQWGKWSLVGLDGQPLPDPH